MRADMIVDLANISTEGLNISRAFMPKAISFNIEEAEIRQPINLDVRVTKVKQGFRFQGTLRGQINLQCARCLEFFEYPIYTSFDLVYKPLMKTDMEEIELKEQDMNVCFISGEKVDLRELMREQILLLLPMKPLCSSKCKGLCPECGINLNVSKCNCNQKRIDPRLKPLLKIKDALKT